MLKEAMKIIENNEIEKLKQKISNLTKSIKKTESDANRKDIEKEIETLKLKMKRLGYLNEEEVPPKHEWNEGPNRSNVPSLQVLHVVSEMKTMLKEMKDHLQWEREEESKMFKKDTSSHEHEKELLYYEQQIDLMEGLIKQLQAAAADMQKIEKKIGLVKESANKLKNTKMVGETVSVTDYNPPSYGGTRKELLAKFAKTKDPKDAEAARKAGATQKELQDAARK